MRIACLVCAMGACLFADRPGIILLDDRFADANSQNQDLANNSVWLFNGRANTVRTDQPGSVQLTGARIAEILEEEDVSPRH